MLSVWIDFLIEYFRFEKSLEKECNGANYSQVAIIDTAWLNQNHCYRDANETKYHTFFQYKAVDIWL